MTLRTERNIWTYLIVTAVTIVIWFIAASETRERRTMDARLRFEVADDSARWVVQPPLRTVRVSVEGSSMALDAAQRVAEGGLSVELPPVRGSQSVGLIDLIRQNSALSETGVTIASVEPTFIEIARDEIVSVPARVRASLPGVQTDGEVTIEPSEVTVLMPSAVRERAVGELTVEAFIDRAQLERLAPGVRHEQEAKLRLNDALLSDAANISILPGSARLGFTIRSRTEQAVLDVVRVHLTGPPEDNHEYIVDLEDQVVRNVTITGDAELIRRILIDDEVRVFAQLYVLSQEKEQRIASKRISHFVAYLPDGSGGTRGVIVEGHVDNPEIRLRIERKEAE